MPRISWQVRISLLYLWCAVAFGLVGAIVLQWFRGTRAQRGAKLPVKEAWRQGQQDTLSRTACSFLGHGLQNLVI